MGRGVKHGQLLLQHGSWCQAQATGCECGLAINHMIITVLAAVHGDLREDNAMLGPPDESGRRDLVFIDFEWAGLEGQVRYPVSINTAAFWNGAGPGQEILKQHDRNMVESWGP